METAIKTLFDKIMEEKKVYLTYADIFGKDHRYTLDQMYKVTGLEDAFAIVAGQKFYEYLFKM